MNNKILIITHDFLPDLDGGIIVAYDYANLLVDLGYEVTVISKTYVNPLQNTKFNLLQVPNRYGSKLWLFNYKKYFRKLDLSVYKHIILNQSPSAIFAGRYFTKEILAKCIIIVQGLEIEWVYKNKDFFSRLYNTYLLHTRFYHKKAIRYCRKVASVSYAHMNKMIKNAGLEKYKNKFQVVHTGIDNEVFHYVESDFRTKNGFTDNHNILISVSRIEKMKGYFTMLSIFESLITKDDSFRWIIIGDGPYLSELKTIILQKKLSEHITLLGRIDRKNLNYYYSAANCFWLLSDYDECLPLVYLEAQACGIPAIGRNKGGVVETINPGKTGFLVNSEEEILNILLNKEYQKISKEDLNSFVKHFDKIQATKELIS